MSDLGKKIKIVQSQSFNNRKGYLPNVRKDIGQAAAAEGGVKVLWLKPSELFEFAYQWLTSGNVLVLRAARKILRILKDLSVRHVCLRAHVCMCVCESKSDRKLSNSLKEIATKFFGCHEAGNLMSFTHTTTATSLKFT